MRIRARTTSNLRAKLLRTRRNDDFTLGIGSQTVSAVANSSHIGYSPGELIVDEISVSTQNPDCEIAVGTTIADCPPHGPGRALLSASGSYRG